MTRTRVVQNLLQEPGSDAPIRGAHVAITLSGPGFVLDGTAEKLAIRTVKTDATGQWSVELEVNADLDPAESFYTVTELPGQTPWSFRVPPGVGAINLRNCLLVDPPAPDHLPAPSTFYVDSGDASTLAAAKAYTDDHAGGGLPSVIDLGGPNNTTGA